MKLHANAPLGPKGRATMVRRVLEEGIALTEAAEAAGVSARTAGKWLRRYRDEGEAGLLDRSSAPRTVHNATPAERVPRLQTGWECVHVCVDDATRLAYVEVLPNEKKATVIGFLKRAVGFYRSHGVMVQQLMTDNGSAYRSAAHALACRAMGIKHIRTRPYRPQTNGKAERFIRTMLREWAYAAVYGSSPERAAALSGWVERYNFRRRHGALGHRPPVQRLRELGGNNVAGIYI